MSYRRMDRSAVKALLWGLLACGLLTTAAVALDKWVAVGSLQGMADNLYAIRMALALGFAAGWVVVVPMMLTSWAAAGLVRDSIPLVRRLVPPAVGLLTGYALAWLLELAIEAEEMDEAAMIFGRQLFWPLPATGLIIGLIFAWRHRTAQPEPMDADEPMDIPERFTDLIGRPLVRIDTPEVVETWRFGTDDYVEVSSAWRGGPPAVRQLEWIMTDDGEIEMRVPAGGGTILWTDPRVEDDLLRVTTREGEMVFRVEEGRGNAEGRVASGE